MARIPLPLVLQAGGPFVGEKGVLSNPQSPLFPQAPREPQNNSLTSLAFTPIRLEVLLTWLKSYPNREAADYLGNGFSQGFRIPVVESPVARNPANQKSVRELPQVARKKIAKEVAMRRMAGPFVTPPFQNLHVSPLGIVPKKAPGEFRLIHNLSHPMGTSVNDVIPPELCSVKYASLDQAIKLIRSFGHSALLAKCDIESAFRLLPIHPEDFWLLGFQFEGNYYFDKAMPMGCSIACAAFESFSTFLEWALKSKTGLSGVTHYLDDFLVASASDTGDCSVLLQAFADLTQELGVPLAADKTEGPSTRLTYLGILLDTVAQTSSLPSDKLANLRRVIEELLPLRKVSLRQLQSLLGHLNFACRVVAPGRPFCSRLARLTSGLKAPHHRVRLSSQVKVDLSIWLEFLEEFNGVSLWQDTLNLQNDFQVQSDAAGSLGFGLYWKGRWCAERWPKTWQGGEITRDLTFLEFFPIAVAVHLWVEEFRNRRVCFWTNNQAVVSVLAKLSSRSPRVSALLRVFVLHCLRNNIVFSARFVPGVSNEIADALSRFQMERFRLLVPEARIRPECFPEHLWSLGSN
ncbi:uncharacterized protein LOC144328967 [Podarcis muralis]